MQLSDDERAELIGARGECVFSWTNADGYPVGVVVAYVYKDGTFWTTCAERRKRVPALRKRPQSGIVVNRAGVTASFKGDSVVHAHGEPGWDELKSWFYDALSGINERPDDTYTKNFRAFLDSPHRVIVETPARLVVDFSAAKFAGMTQEAIAAGLGVD
jgi:hypothetical protein